MTDHRPDTDPQQALTAREVYQVLKDIALGTRSMRRITRQRWAQIRTGPMALEVEGWALVLYSHGGELDYVQSCQSPDGRRGDFASWQRYGTDPVSLLSIWEHNQLEKMLGQL